MTPPQLQPQEGGVAVFSFNERDKLFDIVSSNDNDLCGSSFKVH